MKKRILSLFLALAMILSCVPTAFAAGEGTEGPLSLTDNSSASSNELEGTTSSETAEEASDPDEDSAEPVDTGLTKFESSGWTPFSENEAATAYASDDIVTFIVVMEEKPLLSLYSVGEIADQTAAVQSYEKQQLTQLDALKASVQTAFGAEESFELGFTYTIATTGFSVTTAYGNKAEIEAMKGVKSVYVAPTFSLPEDGLDVDYTPYTNNASTMIGSDVLNESGYTGKGMRIAILDTGIRKEHPNFEALPDEVLVDPMTRESVEEIWDTLNASQMTNMLNISYVSTKIPFAFNYVSGDFNVANTYAGSDHGTHVAGIAAANKIDGSDVVGVAPDAQLVVMQVFQSGGGANWATIMAALEDCVRLEVDAANLSLGAAAGFTDPEGDMLDTLNLFLDSDIQILIASGNDTNNAYGNAWGYNMSLLENPDTGLAGTPSTYSAALAVASVDNDGYEQLYITVNGQDFGYQDTAATAATSFINNFYGQELEYIVIPGVGEEADYEGLDVTGKVALISRGTTSFPEKQALAQEHGAIACVIYNNTLGIFGMQINDGEGNIPAVSVSMAAGAYLVEQAGEDGVGTLTVCNADTKIFKIDRTVSSFSSWGVTPDLKLKPEISGVGGSIYSTVDPDISGSNYGYMSGTSMATPQITGAMAVLIEYLDENYPGLTGAEQRKVAANLLMSTADPLMATETLEYSPRAQGAGLANLVKATTSGAYLSNPAASEGRPKVEFGDDPAKSGVYSFSFTITNMTGEDKTYTFDSSVLTESIYAGYFIANSPYGLEAKVETPEQVTVAAGSTVTVNAKLTLTENDKAYLAQFPNGIYVEGYLYAIPETSAEAEEPVVLTMPMVGFYGDWSDADIFDSQDTSYYSLYPSVVYTYYSQVGTNPYFRSGKSGDEYNAFSYSNPLYEIDFGMLRNAKYMYISVTNAETGELYYELDGYELAKSYYNASYGMVIPMYLQVGYDELWDGKDLNGKTLPEGTTVTYKFEAWLDDGDDVMDDSWSFNMTLDNVAPELLNEDALQDALRLDTETGRSYLTVELQDDQYIAALIFTSTDGAVMGKYEIDNVPGETFTGEFEITGFGSEFLITVADYACNETEIEVMLDLGDQNNAQPEPGQLDKDRLYGCETFDSALVEGGWFSANKADFSDPRNETYNSSNRYYAAEYVNGYLIAQSTATGNLELITPNGSYWSSQVLCENNGSVGDYNVWVLYDMALDHSGTLSSSYGISSEAQGTDSLLAVGWLYKGDSDGDSKDDGYNALFNIKFTSYGSVYVQEIARIGGVENGADLLTLGITTDGKVYGIDTNAILYSIGTETVWDDSIGNYGDYVIPCTKIGETSFVNYPGYGGANVIQSMGYDHNTGTMYWYAHSQVANGYYYDNINVTYKVDLETGECTEVGTYGAGGQTCLFVPNDLESDLFTMGVVPTGLAISPDSLTLVAGQAQRLKIEWTPWNAEPSDVTWASLDESVVTVDQYGYLTAVAEGTATITATAEIQQSGYWDFSTNPWTWVEGGMGDTTVYCYVTVVPSEDTLYGYIIEDYGAALNNVSWVTYSDQDVRDVTVIGKQYLTSTDMEGNEYTEEPLWAGGTYYNGYVYTTVAASWSEDNTIYSGTKLYRSKVTEGAVPAETTIGEPELIGVIEGLAISAMSFDYNTGRMYCVENQYVGGLGIIDLETAEVDMLGTPNGDLSGAVYIPGLCVTADGTIVISDAEASLYTIDPDTLTTTKIYQGSGSPYTAFYEGMTYDYNTGNIYWNMCDGNGSAPLYLVIMPENEWSQATVVDMGDVSTKNGTQQTVLFTIPENEPETQFLPAESIDITNGDTIVGLENGSLKLDVVTVPARPTVQKKTWTSSDESVVTVDSTGTLTYVGVGTAAVTVSISNKDGSVYTDSIEVTVLESAGAFEAFLSEDMNGSNYYQFWLNGNDYDLTHTAVGESMISVYNLRTGVYYDGYYYGYADTGEFLRIDPANPAAYKILGTVNLDTNVNQVTAMAVDYASSTVYGLTLPANYSFSTWGSTEQPGSLVTIDLTNGSVTEVAQLSFETPVFALACDADGQLYAAGGSFDYYSTTTELYKLDKATGELTPYVTIYGAGVYTGPNYYDGSFQYNSQMTYDFGTDRLYLNATSDHPYYSKSYGVYMIQLGEEPTVASLGDIRLNLSGSQTKDNDMFLGLLAFLPEEGETPQGPVSSIVLNKTGARIPEGYTVQLTAQVIPSNASDTTVTWSSSDETVAVVDENGLVTGLTVGTAVITATSNENGAVTATCTITVVDVSGPYSTAYTVSGQKDALMTFNPALPGVTAEKVVTLNGGSNVKGLAYGDNCLYYAVEENGSPFSSIYRMDLLTKQSTYLGQIYTWVQVNDIAYDSATNLLYATAGFYLFQFDLGSLSTEGLNYYTNSIYLYDYNTYHTFNTAGVEVVDGQIYVFTNDFTTNAATVLKYADKYLSSFTVEQSGMDLNLVQGATEVAYDASSELFYVTDAGHNIYSMDWDGNVEFVDLLGDGIDLNGLAIDPTPKYDVTYTDGVDGEEVFADQKYAVAADAATPAFVGTPERAGYTFTGWTPEVSETVTAHVTYTATWTANTYTLTLMASRGSGSQMTVTYGEPVGPLPVPSRAGYLFLGWFDADGNEYTAETVYTVAGDTTVTALWSDSVVAMYRVYNPNSGEHFFTGNEEELDTLIGYGWQYEGIAFYAPTEGEAVYRVYNPNSGDHHYTMAWEEVEMLERYGWQYEGIGWYSADSSCVPQYRLWNPNADCGSHHYTSSEEERDILIGYGWIWEGIGWYSVK